jgi:uncharacterized protein (DUF433 family)
MDRLTQAREMVVIDPGILWGIPVIKGTRVPVYDVAAMYSAGVQTDEVLETYPSLKEWQIELASVYADAFPRPPKIRRHVGSVKVIKRKQQIVTSPEGRSGEINK